MKPTVGRIVHFYKRIQLDDIDQLPLAAMITSIPKLKTSDGDPWCGISIFSPNGVSFGLYPYSREPKPGHWTWPPREQASV